MLPNRSLGSSLDFSLDEIREELANLGVTGVLPERLHKFKHDLDELIRQSSCLGENDKECCHDEHFHKNSTDQSTSETSNDTLPRIIKQSDTGQHFLKRKTVRHHPKSDNGRNFSVDESISELSFDASDNDNHFANETPVYDNFNNSSASTSSISKPRSVIYSETTRPTSSRINKHDPVSRYFQYRQYWNSYLTPAEKQHKSLRWEIRERMLCEDVISNSCSKSYSANTFVVPSEKKRQALRWKIRSMMAQKSK